MNSNKSLDETLRRIDSKFHDATEKVAHDITFHQNRKIKIKKTFKNIFLGTILSATIASSLYAVGSCSKHSPGPETSLSPPVSSQPSSQSTYSSASQHNANTRISGRPSSGPSADSQQNTQPSPSPMPFHQTSPDKKTEQQHQAASQRDLYSIVQEQARISMRNSTEISKHFRNHESLASYINALIETEKLIEPHDYNTARYGPMQVGIPALKDVIQRDPEFSQYKSKINNNRSLKELLLNNYQFNISAGLSYMSLISRDWQLGKKDLYNYKDDSIDLITFGYRFGPSVTRSLLREFNGGDFRQFMIFAKSSTGISIISRYKSAFGIDSEDLTKIRSEILNNLVITESYLSCIKSLM